MSTATERWAARIGSPTPVDERSAAEWPASVQVLPDCFEWTCERSPERVAVEVEGAPLAYPEPGARIFLKSHLGSVSVVGTGLGRGPDVTARALLALENERIESLLVTSAPNRVSLHVQTRDVHRAVRLLHAAFGLHRDFAAERGLDDVSRSSS